MKRVWRWTRRITLGVVAFAVFATAVTIGVLHTQWGRERVRRIVEAQLQSAFPGSTVGRIDGSVFGQITAHDITIMGRDKRPFVTVKTVRIDASLKPLLGKTARVDAIEAEDVVVYVHDQGPKPAEKPTSGPSEPSAWSVELPAIHVKRGRVEIQGERGTEVVDQLDANLALALRANEPLAITVNAGARWRGQPVEVVTTANIGDTIDVPYAIASLGGARVTAAATHVDGMKIAGSVMVSVPAALVRQLAQVELPGDATLVGRMSPRGGLELTGAMGAAKLHVLAATDLEKQTARALVTADVPDVAPLSRGAATGRGTVVAAVVADPEHVDGIVSIVGSAHGASGSVLLGINATLDRARVVFAAQTESPPSREIRQGEEFLAWRLRRLGGSSQVVRSGASWLLSESRLDAVATSDKGDVSLAVEATGLLAPAPSLNVRGTIDGRNIRQDDLSLARVQARFAATDIPARPSGNIDLEVSGTQKGTLRVPLVALGARGALHEDGTIDVDLGRHAVRTADGQAWGGNGGHVRVTEQSIAVTSLVTGSGAARITAQAQVGRTTDALIAKVTARDIAVATIDPTLKGTLAADIDVSRRGGVWKGTVDVNANQIAIPKRPVLDGKLAVKIDNRRVTASITGSNPAIGSATVDLDVVGPRDITDGLAWQRLERSSIQRVRIALSKIDASKLGASGSLDGELAISAIDAGGKVDVKGVVTDYGAIDSQLALAPGPRGEIAAHGTLRLGGVDPVDVDATLALPVHPFDPAGWDALGRATLREATIEAKRIAFDPALLKRFGVITTWRGWAAAKIKIGPEARSSDFVVDVHELRDGPLKKPLEVHITGGSDAHGPHLDATVKTDKVSVALTAKSPLSIDAMLAGNALAAPIEATLTVPSVAARDVAQIIGRDDVLGGTLSGTVTVAGTVAEPTARAVLAVDSLAVAGGIASKPSKLDRLELDARWNGVKQGFELELTGHEGGDKLLKISARGKPDQPDTIVASIEAGNFDIAPFVAFAPPTSMAIGTRAQISGVLKLKGLDPNTGDVRGRIVVSNARIPLTPELGNLRNGTIEINVIKKEIIAQLDGKLGRGSVKGKATVRLTGSMPTAAELSLALRKVSPIGEVQPVIDADVSGWFARTKTKWTGKLTIANGSVYVPPESGNELLTTGRPADLVFIDAQPILVKPKRKPPTVPFLVATIDIRPTKILVDDLNFNFDGVASGHLELQVGDGVGLDGEISMERGVVDVLGRRYRLDHGVVAFDGSLDPRLDIEMMHDFKTMALTVDISGRSSEPDLRLSSDAGAYSQSQLLSFLAGATPSDDPSATSSDAVTGGGLTLISSRLGRQLNKRVPLLKFDTINYEAKTASSSRAIRVGKNIGDKTFLSYRNRFEPRPDENAHEATIEHELPHNIVIEAAGGERGAGADLLWRKRW